MTNNTMLPEKQAKLDYEQMKGKSKLKGDSELNVASSKLPKGYLSGPPSIHDSLMPENDDFSPSVDIDRVSIMSSQQLSSSTPSVRQQKQFEQTYLEPVIEQPKEEQSPTEPKKLDVKQKEPPSEKKERKPIIALKEIKPEVKEEKKEPQKSKKVEKKVEKQAPAKTGDFTNMVNKATKKGGLKKENAKYIP